MSMEMAEAFQVWPELLRVTSTDINLTQCPDLELTRRVAGGNMQAFEEVYRRHHRRVYGLCLRMTQNVEEAEDVAQ